jgi:ABC-type uncharacterized transport system fused permease/ATPase subunit
MLPIIVVAPEYFAGAVELGVIQQASAAFGHILDDLSIVVTSFTDVAQFSAGIDRLFSFLSAIMVLDSERSSMGSLLSISKDEPSSESERTAIRTPAAIQVEEFSPLFLTDPSSSGGSQPSTILSIRGLCLATPDNKRILVQNLNLSLSSGSNLLIVGASGSGKSSLLRVIAGLWSTGKGQIKRPSNEHVYFLPQRPYCPPGSLRDQLLYPSTEHSDFGISRSERPDGGPSLKDERRLWKDWTDADLLNVLERVDLPDLATRSGDGDPYRGLNAVLDWSNTLSLGEQQRLAFGRLLVNRPILVVMDESTSALDVVAEKKMYTLLKEVAEEAGAGGGLTYISVGHRPTLLAYHHVKLSLREGSGYLTDIPPNAVTVDEGFILS